MEQELRALLRALQDAHAERREPTAEERTLGRLVAGWLAYVLEARALPDDIAQVEGNLPGEAP
jgi:hypothetical protein